MGGAVPSAYLPDLKEGLLGLDPDVAPALEQVIPRHPLLGEEWRPVGGGLGSSERVLGGWGQGNQPSSGTVCSWAQGGTRTCLGGGCPLTASSLLRSWAVSFHTDRGTAPTATWLRPSSACRGSSRLGRKLRVTLQLLVPTEPPAPTGRRRQLRLLDGTMGCLTCPHRWPQSAPGR